MAHWLSLSRTRLAFEVGKMRALAMESPELSTSPDTGALADTHPSPHTFLLHFTSPQPGWVEHAHGPCASGSSLGSGSIGSDLETEAQYSKEIAD